MMFMTNDNVLKRKKKERRKKGRSYEEEGEERVKMKRENA